MGGRGPGYALRDILAGAPAVARKAGLIAHLSPDILVLSGIDHDHDLVTLRAFRDLIGQRGPHYPHLFAFASNAGLRTGQDMTGDGRTETADDTQGHGAFRGAKALALLSRFPIEDETARDFSGFLWRDLPDAMLPDISPDSLAIQRLSSTGHWDVPVRVAPDRRLHLLIYQAGPPVFGGQSNRNRMRNHDETAFWTRFLDGRLPMPPPAGPFVLVGGSNLDPEDGDGLHDAMRRLLAHPSLQDPRPASEGARLAGQDSRNAAHRGAPELDTVHWPQSQGPGNLRVSYILPARGLHVTSAGVFWPAPDSPEASLLGDPDAPPTQHRPVWLDIALDSITD